MRSSFRRTALRPAAEKITSDGPRLKGLKRAASETRRQNFSRASRAPDLYLRGRSPTVAPAARKIKINLSYERPVYLKRTQGINCIARCASRF